MFAILLLIYLSGHFREANVHGLLCEFVLLQSKESHMAGILVARADIYLLSDEQPHDQVFIINYVQAQTSDSKDQPRMRREDCARAVTFNFLSRYALRTREDKSSKLCLEQFLEQKESKNRSFVPYILYRYF